MMDALLLQRIAPRLAPAMAAQWAPLLGRAMQLFSIMTPAQQACFVAQVLHETANLTQFQENLNYRPQVLMQTFHGKFTPDTAAEYGFIPGHQHADVEMIANIVYSGRYGNGPIHSGDGYKYRGRGPFQITFRDNYARCGRALGLDLLKNPDLLLQPEHGANSAGWYWHEGNPTGVSLNRLADSGMLTALCRAINGGDNGLAERLELSKRALDVMTGREAA